jgi:endonuclease/exonuclease/phosphatase family metal-dependent hydrolase
LLNDTREAIDLAAFESWFRQDLKKPVAVRQLTGNLFSADNAANLIGVEVLNDNAPAEISGAVMGYVIRSDGATVLVQGTLEGNKCSVTLPSSCYAVIGQISIVIKLGTTTVLACTGYVYQASTDAIVDPGSVIPSISELLEKIDEMEQGTAAANTAAQNANTAASKIPAGGATGAVLRKQSGTDYDYSWDDTTLPGIQTDVSNLKSAFIQSENNQIPLFLINNEYIDTTGKAVSYSGWKRTDYILITPYSSIFLKSSRNSAYNAFYSDADEASVISRFSVTTTLTELQVPFGAKYIRLSNTDAGMDSLETQVIPTVDAYLEATRNLADSGIVSGTINTSGNNQSSDTMSRMNAYFPVSPNKTYYFALDTGTGRAFFYDSQKTFLSYTSGFKKSSAFTTPDQCAFVRFTFSNDVSKVTLSEFWNNIYDKYIPPKTLSDYTARDKLDLLNKCVSSNTIKVCSFNVGKWYDGRTNVPTEKIAEQKAKWLHFMGKENLDFMCMQETTQYFDQSGTITPFDSFLHTSFLHLYDTHETEDHGNAIATRHAFHWVGYSSMGLNTGSLAGLLYCNNHVINVRCVHLSTEKGSSGRRVADMQRIADWLATQEYAIVLGDFNAYSADEYNVFSNYNMANCGDFGQIETWTPTSSWTFGCMDNIITTKNIEISDAYAYTDAELSDHKPLIARLLIKN